MSKKKTSKRLESLFEDVQKEDAKPVKRARKNTGALPDIRSPLHPRPRTGSQAKTDSTRLEETLAMTTAVSNNSGAMSLAFRTDEKSWATLRVVDEESPRAWAMEEQMLVKQVADQLSLALENARLFEETTQRNKELAALNEIIAAASQTLDINATLGVVLEKVLAALDFDAGIITMFNQDRGKLERAARIGLPGSPSTDPAEGLKGSLCEHTFNENQVVALDDLRVNSPINVNDLIRANYLSYLGIPLEAKGQALGTLCVFRKSAGAIQKTTIALAVSISSQISLAIQNANLFQSTEKSEIELRALFSAMTDVIIVCDKEGRYVRIAPTNPSRLFRPAEEMLGQKVDEILPAQVARTIMSGIQQALDAGETIKVEYPLTINQKEYWFDGSISKLNENEVFLVARDITDRKHNELIQAAITQISEAALNSPDLSSLLTIIHENIGNLMPARNFYVALYDEQADMLSFPYYADEYDSAWAAQKPGQGLTSYVLQTGKPLLVTPEIYEAFEKAGTIKGSGTRGIDWLGAPLRSGQKRIGVIAVQTYDPAVRLTETDRDTLSLLAGQAAIAIERKRDEQTLKETEERLRLIIETVPIPILISAATDGTVLFSNPQLGDTFGVPSQELIGRQTPDFYRNPSDRQPLMEKLRSNGVLRDYQLAVKKADGTPLWMLVSMQPLTFANQPALLSAFYDVTDRRRAEEALQRRNEYLAASAEIGRLVTSTLDLNTIFSRTVKLIAERFGYYHSAIFVIEETGFNAVMQEAVGPAAEEMKRIKHGLPVNEQSIVGKAAFNGEPVIVNNTALDVTHKLNPLLPDTQAEAAIPLRVGSRIIGALDIQSTTVGAFTPDDISVLQILADQVAIAIDNARSYELSQQAVMEMREVDRLKSQFLANMSHELRTPLNSIIGFSRVILKGIDGAITELQQQDLTAIYNSGQHLLGLINDVLDLAKIEAGKMELAFDEVNIADLINSVASTTSGLIKDKPIKFVKNIQGDMPPVRADAIRVRQIMINLISNAAKFTEAGDIVLDAHLQPGSTGRAEILISVTDTGPGITPEDQAKLFQAFSQVDDSPTRKTGGTGLGLSISQQLVQMHGGQIGVHSVVGKGSTFYFTLPVYRTKDEPTQPGSVKVILAVDDDPQVISLYERYLQPQGYQVISVTDPTKAKERAKQLNPYAITLDIMMPGYDGWSVLADLKSDADTREIPVVICSIIEEQERGFSLGAADYLLKPILEEDLLGSLDRLNVDGSIREVLIIDDDPNSLRLMEKIFDGQGRYKTVLAEGGKQGWDSITKHPPQAVILDLFMPEMDGFSILEKMRENRRLRDVPVIVVSGGDLTPEQHKQLSEFGQRLVNKGSLNEKDFINNIERALKRAQPKK